MGWLDRLRAAWSGTLRTSSAPRPVPPAGEPAVVTTVPGSMVSAPGGAESAAPFPSNPALEAALLGSPDDSELLLVYADWLQQQGHPAGELVALQCALAAASTRERRAELGAAETALLARHGAQLLGPFHRRPDAVRLTWRGGFIRAARIAPTPAAEPRLVGELLDLPCARLLEKLGIGGAFTGPGPTPEPDPHLALGAQYSLAGVVDLLAARGLPPLLRSLALDTDLSRSPLANLEALYPRMARIEQLQMFFMREGSELGRIDLPSLRELTLRGSVGSANVASLAAARCPELARLEVEPWDYESTATELLPPLEGDRFPKLAELVLRVRFADTICHALLRNPALARRLVRIGLGSDLTDDGAAALARGRGLFSSLVRLDVSHNAIGRAGGIALRRAFGSTLELGQQRLPPDEPS